MKLEFLFVPTSDLSGSLALYRDGLGFSEVWREGESTVVLAIPGTDVQLMLDANDPDAPLGPRFVVDSVRGLHASRAAALSAVDEPSEIPGGFLATYRDPGGATIYVMDQSTDAAAQRVCDRLLNEHDAAGVAARSGSGPRPARRAPRRLGCSGLRGAALVPVAGPPGPGARSGR